MSSPAFLVFSLEIVMQLTKTTPLSALSDLYSHYMNGMSDKTFKGFTVHALKGLIHRRGLLDTTELLEALDVFEYECDPADPAFCYHVREIIRTMFRDG